MTDIGLPQWRESRAAALAASEGLRAALGKLGLPERSYRRIRPATTSTGRPYVYVGILNAEAVEAITAVLLHELADPGLPEEQGAAATARLPRRSRPRPDAASPPSASEHGRAADEARPGPGEP